MFLIKLKVSFNSYFLGLLGSYENANKTKIIFTTSLLNNEKG